MTEVCERGERCRVNISTWGRMCQTRCQTRESRCMSRRVCPFVPVPVSRALCLLWVSFSHPQTSSQSRRPHSAPSHPALLPQHCVRHRLALLLLAMNRPTASGAATRDHIATYAPTPEAPAPPRPDRCHCSATTLERLLRACRTEVNLGEGASFTSEGSVRDPDTIHLSHTRASDVNTPRPMTLPN